MSLRDGWSDEAGMMYDCARTCHVAEEFFAKCTLPEVHFGAVYSVWQFDDFTVNYLLVNSLCFWIFMLVKCFTYDFPPLPWKKLSLAGHIGGGLEKVKTGSL